MTVFPEPWTVGYLEFDSTAVDDRGDPIDAWKDPVDRTVMGWADPLTREVTIDGVGTLVVDRDLFVGPDWRSGHRDRVVIDGETFSQVGELADYNHGPFGFAPGGRVRLQRSR